MKLITKAITAFCILCVLISTAAACTGPNCTASTGTTSTDLPSKDEVNSAIMAAKVSNSGNFAENLFSSIKTNHSAWHTDLWTSGSQEVVSVYYSVDSGSYGSYYLDETGNQITPTTSRALKEKYAGDGVGSSITSGTCTGPNCPQSTGCTSGTCTGSNCPLSTGTNSSSVISCPTCGTGTVSNDTTGSITSITPTVTPTAVSQVSTTAPSSSTITLSSNNSTALTTEQQQELDTFMTYINSTQPLTKDGIREQAIKCFFNGV